MENNMNRPSRIDRFFSLVKNLFWVVLLLSFLPGLISGMRHSIEEAISPKVHVGYLCIDGPITDASFYIKQIDNFSKTNDIKALLLKINSPGGYSGSCNAIFNELKRFAQEKPVVSVIENAGASGAYYIALPSKSIIASPLSLVGSIGVFMELPNVAELLSSWKVQYRYVQSGDYKTAGSVVKAITKEEFDYLQKMSDSQYQQFVLDVATERNLDQKNHKQWADGKTFTGIQAHELKLIDKLGSLSDGIDEIKDLLKTTEEVKLVKAKKVSGILRYLGYDGEVGIDSQSMSESVAAFIACVYRKCMLSCTTQHQSHLM